MFVELVFVEVGQLVLVMLLVDVVIVAAALADVVFGVVALVELSWKRVFFFLLVRCFVVLLACSFFFFDSALPTQFCRQIHQKTSSTLRLVCLKQKVEIQCSG